jgi:recombination protein RecA
MNKDVKAALEAERLRMEKKWGQKSADLGSTRHKQNVVSTGVQALDYVLGTGGYPRRYMTEIYGPPDVGKSSILGITAMVNAQKEGLTPGIIALEPGFDPVWAERHGLDTDHLLIGRPDDGQQAFGMLYDWVIGDTVDFILFDSIGAVLRESEVSEKADAPSAFGQAGLITWGLKRCVMPLWKKNKCLILINQVRDDQKSRISGLLDSPGGHALKHSCPIRLQVKFGKERWYGKDHDGDESYSYTNGQNIVVAVKRNKMTEGTGKRAQFDYFYEEVEGRPFGIDTTADIIATALRSGVLLKAGAYYRHPLFPLSKTGFNQVHGTEGVAEFFRQNPKSVDTVRNEMLTVMQARLEAKSAKKPDAPEETESTDED